MTYKTWELIIARALGYEVGRNDDDEPRLPVLEQKHARHGLYIRILVQGVNWLTCFFIIAGVLRHW